MKPRVMLEPLLRGHAAAMFEALADPAVYEFIPEKPPESVDALERRYARLESRRSPDGKELWLNYAVRSLDGEVLGRVEATVVGDRADIAYLLNPKRWGRGFAAEAVLSMLELLRSEFGVRVFRASFDRRNARSGALLKRCGFAFSERTETDDVYERTA